jgi:hypothetical protein
MLQVAMAPEQLQYLKNRARELGFSSAQAYVRYTMNLERLPHSARRELQLNEGCKIALKYCELALAHRQPLPANARQALDVIGLQLKKRAFRIQNGSRWGYGA